MIFVTFSSKTDIFYYRDIVVSCLFLEFGIFFFVESSTDLLTRGADQVSSGTLNKYD